MNDTFSLHVGQNINHLAHEVPSSVFSHASHCLADVEEKTTSYVLKKDIDQICDFTAWWLMNFTIWAPADDIDYVLMLQPI